MLAFLQCNNDVLFFAVDVGFLQEETTCQSDGNCDLNVIVNITMPDSPAVFNFDITLSLSVEGGNVEGGYYRIVVL